MTAGDVVGILRRRARVILWTFIVLFAAAASVVMSMANVYESKSLVIVETPRMPSSYSRSGSLVPPLSQLVVALKQEALSHETLSALAQELNLYEGRGTQGAEPTGLARLGSLFGRWVAFDAVDQAKRDLKVDVVRRGQEDLVEISARARSGELAAQFVNRISDLLSARNRDIRVQMEQDAHAFIDGQVTAAKRRVDAAETALEEFKSKHPESLPENAFVLRTSVDRRATDVDAYRAKIATASEDIARAVARLRALDEFGTAEAPLSGRMAVESELRKSILEEDGLRSHNYGPGWPALQKAHATTERLRAQLTEMDRQGPTATADPAPRTLPRDGDVGAIASSASAERILETLKLKRAPLEVIDVAQSLVTSIDYQSSMVQNYQAELEQALTEISRYERSRSLLVAVAPQLTALEHTRDETLVEYKAALGDLREVDQLLKAENAGRADHFRTLEAATAPSVPSAPNRLLFLAAALAGCSGVSIALGWAIDQARRGFSSAAEVEDYLGLPVLGSIPVAAAPPPTPTPARPRAGARA